MTYKIVLIILAVLVSVCALMFISVIFIKLMERRRNKEKEKDTKKINPVLHKLFSAEKAEFEKSCEHSLSKLSRTLRRKNQLNTLEDILLDLLENADEETAERARIIAYYFKFPEKCSHMIRDRIAGRAAIGCLKAGLYRYKDAVPDILKALDILSSDTQLQAMVALARIGDIDAMTQSYEKISSHVFINERAFFEIIDIFSGDRYELYKRMINHWSAYLVHHFLKSIDKELALRLIDDIVAIYNKGEKESRLASVIAIGVSGSKKKIPLLIGALKDEEWEIRAMAAKTLGILTGAKAIKPLALAVQDSEWWVRQNAATSILAYPDHTEILLSIIKKGDKYAYESILFALEKANKTRLISKIKKAWLETTKSGSVKNRNVR